MAQWIQGYLSRIVGWIDICMAGREDVYQRGNRWEVGIDIAINAPLILKVQDLIFFLSAKHL